MMNVRFNKFVLVLSIITMCYNAHAQDWMDMDGGLWPINGTVKKVMVNYLDSNIYVGGAFDYTGNGQQLYALGHWDKQNHFWIPSLSEDYNGSCRSFVFFMGELYCGGVLAFDDEIIGDGIFKKQDDQWVLENVGPDESPRSLEIVDNNMYCLGGFHHVGELPSYGIAIYDGETFSSIAVDPEWDTNSDANDAKEFNGEIYITGKNLSGFPYYDWSGFAKIEDEELVVAHEEFSGGFSFMWVFGMEIFQDQLVICGNFNEGIGFTGDGIQAFDGENMHAFEGGPNWAVRDMKVYKNELYVVGDFIQIGTSGWQQFDGEPCGGIAKWNGETWTCLNDVEYYPYYGRFRTLEIWEDTLYVGGDFKYLGGDTALTGIARMRIYPDTTLVSIKENNMTTFSVFPNPSHGEITISFEDALKETTEVQVFNHLGQVVFSDYIYQGIKRHQLNLPLTSGIYVIRLQYGDGILAKKIVLTGGD